MPRAMYTSPASSVHLPLLPTSSRAKLIASLSHPLPPLPPPPPGKWTVLFAATVVHALHASCVYLAPTTLLPTIRQSFHVTTPVATWPLVVYRFVQAFFLLPTGLLLDTLGPDAPLRISILSAVLLCPLLPLAQSILQLTVLYALFSATTLLGGLSTLLLLVDRAFFHDGRIVAATSVLLCGYSMAGVITPTVIGQLTLVVGWRTAYSILCVTFATIAAPLVVTVLYASHSADPLGRPNPHKGDNPDAASPSGPLISAGYAITLCVIAAMSVSLHIMLDHLLLILNEEVAMPFATATSYLSLMNLSAVLGKLSIGPIGDRVNKSSLMAVSALLALCGTRLLLTRNSAQGWSVCNSTTRLSLGIILYGVGYACVFTIATASLPELGRGQLATRANLNMVVLFAVGSVASYLAGVLREASGSYVGALWCSCAAWLVVALLALFKRTCVRLAHQ